MFVVCVCVSFFRDNNKPINILTGIDYWLDNLMCNVPELVMCFHVNGIVQVSYSPFVCSDFTFEIISRNLLPPHPVRHLVFVSPAEI